MLRCTWGRGTQMGFRLSRGCWCITAEDPSHVLCAMGVATLDPDPIGHLLREHCQELGLNNRIASTDFLLTQLCGCNIHYFYKFRKLFLHF